MATRITLSVCSLIVLLGGHAWAQYGPPPVVGRQAAAADTGGPGSYGDTMDDLIGNGTRTYWGMNRGLTGDASIGGGTMGYSAMGVAGYGQTTGASQLLPYYEQGGIAGATNFGQQEYGLGATPGFGRNVMGPRPFQGGVYGLTPQPVWSGTEWQGIKPQLIPKEQVQGLMRVTRTPYAPPGNPGFVDPGVSARANEYIRAPQKLTGRPSAYPPAANNPTAPANNNPANGNTAPQPPTAPAPQR